MIAEIEWKKEREQAKEKKKHKEHTEREKVKKILDSITNTAIRFIVCIFEFIIHLRD